VGTSDYITVGLALFSILSAIIGWLLVNKVNRLEADIKQSKEDHTTDAAALTVLQLKVAEHYPSKLDMKEMFESFREYLDERFNTVEQIAKYSGSVNTTNRRRIPRDNEDR